MARFSSRLWIFFSLTVVAIISCVRLGFWQMHRADQKREMVRQHQQLANEKPTFLSKNSKPAQYQPIKLTGRYLSPLLYLDNQHYHHQFGYDIISPFETIEGLIVLVNRGWVAGDVTRQRLPKIVTPTQSTTLNGYVYYPKNNSWRLGPQLEIRQGERYLLEQIDMDDLSNLLPQPLANYTLRLKPEGDIFIRAWPIVAMSPNRHIGYAIQWFVMAFGLGVMLSYFIKKQYDAKSE
jgi:surfeit locus 1 family protein